MKVLAKGSSVRQWKCMRKAVSYGNERQFRTFSQAVRIGQAGSGIAPGPTEKVMYSEANGSGKRPQFKSHVR